MLEHLSFKETCRRYPRAFGGAVEKFDHSCCKFFVVSDELHIRYAGTLFRYEEARNVWVMIVPE